MQRLTPLLYTLRRSSLPGLLEKRLINCLRPCFVVHADNKRFPAGGQDDILLRVRVGIQRIIAEFAVSERTHRELRRAEAVRPHAGVKIAAILDRIDFGILNAQIRPIACLDRQRIFAAIYLHAAGKKQQRQAE